MDISSERDQDIIGFISLFVLGFEWFGVVVYWRYWWKTEEEFQSKKYKNLEK
jgi:hypothetical protein